MGSPHPGTPGPPPGTPLGYPAGHPGNHPGGPQPHNMSGPQTSMSGPSAMPGGPMAMQSRPGTPGGVGGPGPQQMQGPGGPGPGPGMVMPGQGPGPGGHPGGPGPHPGGPGGHPGGPGTPMHPGGPGHPGHPGHPMTRMGHPMSSPLDRDPTMTRHTPYMGQPDYRIYELNKRLQQRSETQGGPAENESDNLWWDAFATEFFEDDATLTLSFCLEDGPKRYTIGRTLIPRYFRTIFEGGVTDLYFILKHPKESFHNTTITLDCDQAMMVTHHGKPMFTKVVTEGRLVLEFTFDDLMRIRSWHFATRQHRELIPRSVIAMQQDPAMVEQLSKNITRQGLTNHTLNFLRLCVILEPMQELMSRHKAYGLSPRDCLKTTLFQKWQRMVAPPGELNPDDPSDPRGRRKTNRQPSKRRKRKSSTSTNASVNNVNSRDNTPGSKQKRSPGPQAFNPVPGDVMVVGEPALMGGEFGDEDERLVTRLENTQYEPNGENDETNTTSTANDPAQQHSNQFQQSPSLQSASWQQDKKPPTTSAAPTDEIKKE